MFGLAQRVRQPTDEERLQWVHAHGSPDGYTAMSVGVYQRGRRLEQRDIDLAQKEITDAIQQLVKEGRITVYHPEWEYAEVAYHRWFPTTRKVAEARASNWSGTQGESEAEMGMYVFDQQLFNLARRGWITTDIQIEKGSKIVKLPRCVLTPNVVGYRANIAVFGGEHNESYVVRFIDGHTIEMDHPSEGDCKACIGKLMPPEPPTHYGF